MIAAGVLERFRLRRVPVQPAYSDAADLSTLVSHALGGERVAWEELVRRLKGVAWRAIGSFDLHAEDRNDAFASTFFRLFERLDTVREPEKLPGWVATTARNEVLTILRARQRVRPTDLVDERPAVLPDHDEALMDLELQTALTAALHRLSPSCQELLRLLTADPPLSYDEISEITGRPRGSIGPSRQRCLEALRRTPELRPFLDRGQA